MMKWQISLRTAAALAFVAVAAVPVWLAWEMPQSAALELEEAQAKKSHAAYADAALMALDRYHRDVAVGFRMLVDDLTTRDALPERSAALDALELGTVCLHDAASGRVLRGFAGTGATCADAADGERFGRARSLAAEGRIGFGGVRLDAAGEPEIMLVQRIGPTVAVGSLGTIYFRELAEAIRFGEAGHAAILDHTGAVVAHPNPEWTAPPRSMADLAVVQRMMAGESGAGAFVSPALDETMATAFRSLPGPGWGILVNQPMREMEAIVTEVKRESAKVLIIALAVAGALAMLAAHLLLGPIRHIRMAAERLGDDETAVMIPPTGTGSRLTEINDLRAAFNAMVLRLRRARRTEVAARREAQEATKSKSRFLANMSHELRTPLNAIIGFAEVTQRRMTGAERERDREYLGYIHDSGRHLLSIINDLLDLARIEAGGWRLDEEDVDVSLAIRDARVMLGSMPTEKNIVVTLDGVEEPVMLWADRRAIRQMLLNLTTNAVRYTQEGGRVSIACVTGRTGAVSIVVSDNGPGIEAGELTRIKAPFARGRAQETAATPGTGLGLSIVDALATMHDARFDLASAPGRGTRATVTFPSERTLLTLVQEPEPTAAQ